MESGLKATLDATPISDWGEMACKCKWDIVVNGGQWKPMLKIHNKSYYATKFVSFTVTEHVRARSTAGVNQRPSKNMKTTTTFYEAGECVIMISTAWARQGSAHSYTPTNNYLLTEALVREGWSVALKCVGVEGVKTERLALIICSLVVQNTKINNKIMPQAEVPPAASSSTHNLPKW